MRQTQNGLFLESLIGDQVNNKKGECLGKIVNLIIDPNTGRIESVVLSLGVPPQFGNALSSVPWESLDISVSQKSLGTSTGENGFTTQDHLSDGTPDQSNHFSVYTFPVRRFRQA